MRFFIILCCVFTATAVFSQNHELLRSRGKLTPNLFGTTQEITSYEVKQKKLQGEAVKENQRKVISGSSELCNEIVMSGRLMINDSLSSYANKVLDVLLKNDLALRKKLHVYFYYSTGTNAITLNNGMIIIEMGLMTHIKNEAQLAFILAHEVSHFRENHFLKYYIYSKEQLRTRANDPLSAILTYSRELEQQADSLGFELYKSSGYDLLETMVILDIMKTAHLPSGQIPFSPTFFEHGDYKFPLAYIMDTLVPVVDSFYDETKGTHPSWEKRLEKIVSYLDSSNPDGHLFIVSEAAFNALQSIAREECCNLYLEYRDYGNAIYSAYVLLKEDTLNAFAKSIMGKALYELAAYKILNPPMLYPRVFITDYDPRGNFNFESDDDMLTAYTKVEGESQKLHYFLDHLGGPELTILSLDWNWRLYRESNYKDPLLSKMCSNLFNMLSSCYSILPSEFKLRDTTNLSQVNHAKIDSSRAVIASKLNLDTSWRSYSSNNDLELFKASDFIPLDPNNKPDLLAKAELDVKIFPKPEYMFRAFDDFISDELFHLEYKKNKLGALPLGIHIPSWYIQPPTAKGLGVDSFFALPPSYYRIKEIDKTRTYYYGGTSAFYQTMQQKKMLAAGRATKTNFILLTPEKLDSSAIADYNTFCLLNQWLNESLSHISNAYALNVAHTGIGDSLSKRFGIQYIMYSTTVCVTNNSDGGTQPSKMQTFVFDLKTGSLILYYDDIIYGTGAGQSDMYYYYGRVFNRITTQP